MKGNRNVVAKIVTKIQQKEPQKSLLITQLT